MTDFTFRELLIAHALSGLLANAGLAKDATKQWAGDYKGNQAWHAETAIAFADAVIARIKDEAGENV